MKSKLEKVIEGIDKPERINANLWMAETFFNELKKLAMESKKTKDEVLNEGDIMLCGFMLAGIAMRETIPDRDLKKAGEMIALLSNATLDYLRETWETRGLTQ